MLARPDIKRAPGGPINRQAPERSRPASAGGPRLQERSMSLATLIAGFRPALPASRRLAAPPRVASPTTLPATPVLHRGGAPAQRLLPLRSAR
jgi:hypothetical protein